MKQKARLGILAAADVLAACITCQAGVYSQGIYSMGTTYYGVCSTTLPFPPFTYGLEEISWREDANGLAIIDLQRQSEPGDVSRRYLEVRCGSERFSLPLDSGSTKRFRSKDDPPVMKESGNLAFKVTQCAATRGVHANTNAFPVVLTGWIRASRTNEDIFVLEGDHYTVVQNFLERAYGKPDGSIPATNSAGGNGCSTNFVLVQNGVLLNLTRTWDDTTIISIISKQKPQP